MYLGIDIGTGSTKAVLADAEGVVIDTASRSHKVSLPGHGRAEFDAEGTWWRELTELCRELLGRNPADRVRAVCVSGMGPCLVLTDDRLQPTRPAILYGVDTRAEEQVDALTRELGAAQILQIAGKALSSQAVGPKIRWVREVEPEVYAASSRFFSSNSYLVAKLTGEYVLDHHTASQYAPMYDMRSQGWHESWASDIAGALALPRLVWSDELVGQVTAAAADATGIPAGTPVCAGTVDAWAEAYSAGVRRDGDVMVMYGSTMFFVQQLADYRIDPLLWTTVGIERGSLTLAAGTSTGGSITTWARELFGDVSFDALQREMQVVPAGSEGLLVLPYFQGERTPIFDPRARGVMLGLSLRHTRAHVLHAMYEGIAFGTRQILERLEQAAPARRLIAVGGGTQSAAWVQAMSDITGMPQVVPSETIGASYGDALMAAIGVGDVAPGTVWAKDGRTVEPNPEHLARYDEMYQLFTTAYPMLRDHLHALADIADRSIDA